MRWLSLIPFISPQLQYGPSYPGSGAMPQLEELVIPLIDVYHIIPLLWGYK